MSKNIKWKRLPSGALQSRDASVFKNAVGSYFVCVSQVLATEEEAKEWAENVLSVEMHDLTMRAEQAERQRDALHEFVADEAERDCAYGDNCPSNAGTRHGTCTACRARDALRSQP